MKRLASSVTSMYCLTKTMTVLIHILAYCVMSKTKPPLGGGAKVFTEQRLTCSLYDSERALSEIARRVSRFWDFIGTCWAPHVHFSNIVGQNFIQMSLSVTS